MYCRSKLYLFLQSTLYYQHAIKHYILTKYVVFYSITNLLCSSTIHKHSQIQTHTRSLLDVKSATSNLIVTMYYFFVFPFCFSRCTCSRNFSKVITSMCLFFINLLVSAKTKEKWKYSKDIENKSDILYKLYFMDPSPITKKTKCSFFFNS
jgi:hypothetical protein